MFGSTLFGGRVVEVWAKEPAKGCVLQNARVRWLGSRAFLVGQVADYGKFDDPRGGAHFWLPVDDVIMLTEYGDLQSARKAYEAREKKAAADAKGAESHG